MYASIIIPTYNRCDMLRRTLESLLELSHTSQDYEIIVVDNASTDGTRKSVEDMAERHSGRHIRYFYEPIPGLLSGRHRGVLESSGRICAFIDDDVQVDVDWLAGLEDAFRDQQVALVGGPSRPIFKCHAPEWLADFYCENDYGRYCGWLSLFDGGEQPKEIDPSYIWGLNFSIRRTALFNVGGFHPDSIPKLLQRFQGDGETGLSFKIKKAGLKTLYHPKVAVSHAISAARLTVEHFEQRAFYQAVCDSFTQTRAEGTFVMTLQPWGALKSIKRMFETVRVGNTQVREIRRRVARAYNSGFEFHQAEVRRDPKLLEWVLRKDYWDYQLPKGWEKYWAAVDSSTIEGKERPPQGPTLQIV